ncbi:MAG TPA: class I SAM-dependent methyltransferase [Candidatus Saccharimonadales bacterium]|nr:class I SAM-dependent methyltransferase [Candidatus Saccharimonadales bacterium]
MVTQKQLVKIWNQVPPDYYQKEIAKNPLKRFWHTEKVDTFKKLTKGKNFKNILDVGCASGRMANEISKIFPNAKMTGVDAYGKAIEYGKKTYPNIKFRVADAHKLPFKANSFDLVICYEVIEHLTNPLKALQEMKRVLKKDGLAIITMDSGNILFRIVWWVSENTISSVWQNAHLHPFKHTELEKVIKKSGLKIVKKQFSHFSLEVSFVTKKN